MTPQQIEAMKLALEALKKCHYYMIDAGLPNQSLLNKAFTAYKALDTAYKALEEALAQPEQEPVAWPHKYGCRANAFGKCDMGCTTPPQRKPLTDEELEAMAENHVTNCYFDTLKFARAIEAAHNIKENT